MIGKLVGLVARLLPLVMLAEMSLGFLGFSGGALSCGVLVASGKGALLEAPWVTIYPGAFAGTVVLAFSILGQISSNLLRERETIRFL